MHAWPRLARLANRVPGGGERDVHPHTKKKKRAKPNQPCHISQPCDTSRENRRKALIWEASFQKCSYNYQRHQNSLLKPSFPSHTWQLKTTCLASTCSQQHHRSTSCPEATASSESLRQTQRACDRGRHTGPLSLPIISAINAIPVTKFPGKAVARGLRRFWTLPSE